MVILCTETYQNDEYNEHFSSFGFELSDFQKYAIESIVKEQHCLVTAHTGSGKTLPAEFAIQWFTSKGKKVIYTSPIKALSNQKYWDFCQKYPGISVGLFTGDIKINPNADVLIMTTEILMNYLFQVNSNAEIVYDERNHDFQLNIQEELGCVIFDEVHYINDQHRGQNWEKTILMLPNHIQMVMLSATIDRPEKFAQWIENNKNKSVYLCSTYRRVVPLTHYGFMTTNEGIFKKIKSKELQQKIRSQTNDFIVLKTAKDEYKVDNYGILSSTCDLFNKHNIFVNKTHVLNQLVKRLFEKEMLPAIVFVFSRKNVEAYAKSITQSILEFDSKVPYTIKTECDQIIRRLPNYEEYLRLPEYNMLIQLLEKGIGIHHSGMIPVLREIVEKMISKKCVKLLFATESFAIGLDCPIRTAVFTSLTKFDGSKMRYLFPHEYGQAAGRAGRRGLDVVGHVIHCNNMFQLPSSNEYKDILCGKPQTLLSKFNISFDTLLSLMKNGQTELEDFYSFINKSMLKEELNNSRDSQQKLINEANERYDRQEKTIRNLTTSYEDMEKYSEMELCFPHSPNKKKKEIQKNMQNISDNTRNFKTDYTQYKNYIESKNMIKEYTNEYEYFANYVENGVKRMIDLLIEKGFVSNVIEENKYIMTQKGEEASCLAEIHGLVFVDFLLFSNYFETYNAKQIIGLLSVFVDVKVNEDYKMNFPKSKDETLNCHVKKIVELMDVYYDSEVKYNVNSGFNYQDAMCFDLLDSIMLWCDCNSIEECKYFIETQLVPMEVSLGEFTKALLKILAMSKELIKLTYITNNVALEFELSKIESYLMKFIVTTQSIYI